MGVIRKFLGLSTLGMVRYRGDREAIVHVARKRAERGERHARQTEHDARIDRANLKIEQMRAENVARKASKAAAKAAKVVPDPVLPFLPAGWYPDQADPTLVRWFDGAIWTDQTNTPPGHFQPAP